MSSPVRTRSKKPTSWCMMCSNSRLRSRHITLSALALNSLQWQQSLSEHLLQIQQLLSLPKSCRPEYSAMKKEFELSLCGSAASLFLNVCPFLCIPHLCGMEKLSFLTASANSH